VFLIRHLGLGTHQFGWQFVPSVAGIFLGALAANRLAGRLSVPRQVRLGLSVVVLASVANVAWHAFLPPSLPWSIAPLFFYAFGMAVTMPGVTLLVLDLFAEIRGVVASCQSFTMTMLGAVMAGVAAPVLSRSVLALAVGQLACALVALVCWRLGRWQTRVVSARARNAWETLG
jgi:DHA1 family bicyclomycin/chloramphenicol resistance-like MFS transporter